MEEVVLMAMLLPRPTITVRPWPEVDTEYREFEEAERAKNQRREDRAEMCRREKIAAAEQQRHMELEKRAKKTSKAFAAATLTLQLNMALQSKGMTRKPEKVVQSGSQSIAEKDREAKEAVAVAASGGSTKRRSFKRSFRRAARSIFDELFSLFA